MFLIQKVQPLAGREVSFPRIDILDLNPKPRKSAGAKLQGLHATAALHQHRVKNAERS